MCAGMVRDEHSMAAVKAADCNNAALRGGPSSLIRGEICIYQVRDVVNAAFVR